MAMLANARPSWTDPLEARGMGLALKARHAERRSKWPFTSA
jgi:hypothetical protein